MLSEILDDTRTGAHGSTDNILKYFNYLTHFIRVTLSLKQITHLDYISNNTEDFTIKGLSRPEFHVVCYFFFKILRYRRFNLAENIVRKYKHITQVYHCVFNGRLNYCLKSSQGDEN